MVGSIIQLLRRGTKSIYQDTEVLTHCSRYISRCIESCFVGFLCCSSNRLWSQNLERVPDRMNRLASQMNDSARGIRWTYLTAFALFASLSVLGLLVYLTPMEELEKSQSTNPNEPLPSKPTIESQHFVLPDATNALSTEKLQEELRNAAQVLVSDFPNDPAAYHVAAMIHSELRQTKKAVELWEQCLAMGNLDAGPVVGLAGLLIDQGDEEKGAELLSKLEDPSVRTAEYYLKLSQAYSSMGELVKAEEVVREGLRRFSTDALTS